MATISSAGVGSGLDVESIVTKLMAVERTPLTQMQSEASKIQSKLSVYGKVQSYVSALSDAASKLSGKTSWGQTSATSGNEAVFKATTSTGATAGSYSVLVSSLAAAQTVVSATYGAKTDPVGEGNLSIELGSWSADQSSFTGKSGSTAVSIAVSATDTLEDVRQKINAAGAGVSASIVTDASGAKLVLRSSTTGESNGFRMTSSDADLNDADDAGLSKLAFDPSAGINQLTQTQAAANALAVIDGINVSSETNTIEGAIEGVVLKLTSKTTTPVDLTVAADTTTMKANVEAFVKAYNDLAGYLTAQTKYDSASKTAGALQGDSGANALRAALRGLGTSSAGASSTLSRMAQIGLDPQSDGSLKINSAKLTSALESPVELQKMFSLNGEGADDDGFAQKIKTWSDTLLGFDGAVTTRSSSLQSQVTANTKRQAAFEERMTTVEARMRAQYTALDTKMSSLTALSSYVSQQITNWNKSSA